MARSLSHIDSELRKAVARRVEGRKRISLLSQCITADTRLIEELLAERSEVAFVAGASSGR